jgi:hypothetical protein
LELVAKAIDSASGLIGSKSFLFDERSLLWASARIHYNNTLLNEAASRGRFAAEA